MADLEDLLEHRATATPWSPGWARVLTVYRAGLTDFPLPFTHRQPPGAST